MSGILVTWALNRGLSGLEGAVRTALGEHTFEAVARDQLNVIEKQLDSIIDAPFRQALMYFREGNIEKTKDKLIEAMSLNELDLPANALYCTLLAATNATLALQYQEEILRKFGPHMNILPTVLLSWLEQYIDEGAFSLGPNSFELCPNDADNDFYPTAVFCSAWSIVVKWEHKSPRNGVDRFLGIHKPRLIAYDWNGDNVIEVQSNLLELVAVTGEYIVVNTKEDGIRVWSLLRRATLPNRLLPQDVVKLFITGDPVVVDVGLSWPQHKASTFGTVVIAIEERGYKRWEYVSSGSQYARGQWKWVEYTSGKLVLRRIVSSSGKNTSLPAETARQKG